MSIRYEINFEDKTQKIVDIHIDPVMKKILDQSNMPKDLPEWTRLEFKQCKHCPLDSRDYPNCPVAVNIHKLAHSFRMDCSQKDVQVDVITKDRTYSKKTTLQEALQSLFGIFMVTSECPVLDFLKPLALHHLPFANAEETLLRSSSMYLLGQFFKNLKDDKVQINLSGLKKQYADVEILNEHIRARLDAIEAGSADTFALGILNLFAKNVGFQIGHDLEMLHYLFEDYKTK